MDFVEKFQNQHRQIANLSANLLGCFQDQKPARPPQEIKNALNPLMQEIMTHLILEDRALYPSLIGSNDPELRTLAHSLQKEYGLLRKEFERYIIEWFDEEKMVNQASEFGKATLRVLALILKRNARETKELYPLILGSKNF